MIKQKKTYFNDFFMADVLKHERLGVTLDICKICECLDFERGRTT